AHDGGMVRASARRGGRGRAAGANDRARWGGGGKGGCERRASARRPARARSHPPAGRPRRGAGFRRLRRPPRARRTPSRGVTLGKRCARLDLKDAQGRAAFEALLAKADIIVHGYRSDALDRLGYDAAARRRLAPGLIDVALCAYGWSGPWATRRGFDSLVQMRTRAAETGKRPPRADKPGATAGHAPEHP